MHLLPCLQSASASLPVEGQAASLSLLPCSLVSSIATSSAVLFIAGQDFGLTSPHNTRQHTHQQHQTSYKTISPHSTYPLLHSFTPCSPSSEPQLTCRASPVRPPEQQPAARSDRPSLNLGIQPGWLLSHEPPPLSSFHHIDFSSFSLEEDYAPLFSTRSQHFPLIRSPA